MSRFPMTFPLASRFFGIFFMVNHQMLASEVVHNNHSSSSTFKNVAWPHIRAGGRKNPQQCLRSSPWMLVSCLEPSTSNSSVGWSRTASEICCLLHPAHSWHVTQLGPSITPAAQPQNANKVPLEPRMLCAGAWASALGVQILIITEIKEFLTAEMFEGIFK